MKCVVCKHGDTKSGKATVTFDRAGFTLVVRGVPADVCSNCGEEYVGADITATLLKTADDAANAGVKVEVREYAAA